MDVRQLLRSPPVKPQFGPTLPDLLAPRIDSLPRIVARILAAIAVVAVLVVVALIPIGGHYTMDRHDAVEAARMIGARQVIPCHYNTFLPIVTDAEAFQSDVENSTASEVIVLAPGERHTA